MRTPNRPRNVALLDLVGYRLPVAGLISILHRISGATLFLALPVAAYLLDLNLATEQGFQTASNMLQPRLADPTSWPSAIVTCLMVWSIAHHFVAGLRHLWMDVTHRVDVESGRSSAVKALVASLLMTAVMTWALLL